MCAPGTQFCVLADGEANSPPYLRPSLLQHARLPHNPPVQVVFRRCAEAEGPGIQMSMRSAGFEETWRR